MEAEPPCTPNSHLNYAFWLGNTTTEYFLKWHIPVPDLTKSMRLPSQHHCTFQAYSVKSSLFLMEINVHCQRISNNVLCPLAYIFGKGLRCHTHWRLAEPTSVNHCYTEYKIFLTEVTIQTSFQVFFILNLDPYNWIWIYPNLPWLFKGMFVTAGCLTFKS